MLTTLLSAGAWGTGLLLAVFAAYEFVLMVASLPWLLRRRAHHATVEPRTRFLVVIPAHNEGALIAATVRSVLENDYPVESREVVVIADNCDDDTADYARRAGAACLERRDLERRGKPHALHWFFEQRGLSGITGVVIIDADTVVDSAFLRVMDARLQRGERAIQGFYGIMNPDETWLTRLAILPAVVKFYLTFPGKLQLGLSCPLAGNGMCFDAEILRRLGWNAFTLSEDWEYYLILATHGYQVTSAPEAVIHGQVAASLRLGRAQRMRWMKGRMDALSLHWRALLRRGLVVGDLAALDAIVDIARPTHSILFLSSVVYLAVTSALWMAGLLGARPAQLGAAIIASQTVFFLAGLVVARAPLRTWLALAVVPVYLLWKLGVTLQALLTLRQRAWVKTTRN